MPLNCYFKIFVFWSIALSATAQTIQVIERLDDRVRIHFTAGIPEMTIESDSIASYRVEDWPLCRDERGHLLPYRPLLFHLNARSAKLRLVSSHEFHIQAKIPTKYKENAVGLDTVWSAESQENPSVSRDGDEIVQLSYKGKYRQSHLWCIYVFPYQFNNKDHSLSIRTDVIFDILADADQVYTVGQDETDRDFLKRLGVVSPSPGQEAYASAMLKNTAAPLERWKIVVGEDGLYHITGADLLEAGIQLLDIDFRKLRLTSYGKDVPVYPKGWNDGQFDRDDYFEFWGEYNRGTFQDQAADMYQDPFTPNRVYWLSWDKRGLWMAEESGQITDLLPGNYVRPFYYLETVHQESDNYFDHLSSIDNESPRDHWFYDDGISAGKKIDYPIKLLYPDDQSPTGVSARVMLSGRTKITGKLHDVSVFLNDSYLFSKKWSGQEHADLQSEESFISGADLVHGTNILSIVNNINPQEFDFVMLNWFDITYPRLYRANNGILKFKIPPDYQQGTFLFRIDGFAGNEIDIYKLRQSKILGGQVEEVTDYDGFTSRQISFQHDVLSPETEFVAVTPAAKMKPLLIEEDQTSLLRTTEASADYLIIAHRRFMFSPALQELADLRQSQGYRVLQIDVQDVFDEFNFGNPGSYAIKDFLTWAYTYWQPPKIKYVLLVGDGSYLRYTAEGDTLDLVPAHMQQTMLFGAAASDFWYSLISGDDNVPDINIGRLPVRNETELANCIEKIVSYETSEPTGDWPNRLLVIGGNGSDFRTQGKALSQMIPPRYNTRMLFTIKDHTLSVDPHFGGTSDLLDYIDQGCSVITFHGHGGGAIWADNGLLRLEDVGRFYNEGKFPFILSMTCYTGAFESPVRESLADVLLFSEEKGALAMVGASGVGWTWNDYFLQSEILKQIYSNPDMTIGEMITAGKISYLAHYQTSQTLSQLNQYHLLGDPASRIFLPENEVQLDIESPIVLKGDQISASCNMPYNQGVVKFEIEDSLKAIHTSSTAPAVDGQAATTLAIGEDFVGSSGTLRLYGSDDFGQHRTHGYISISLEGIVFDSAYVEQTVDDSLFFYSHVRSRTPLNSVWCTVLNDTIPMTAVENNWYKSTRAIKMRWKGFQFSYGFYAMDENEQSHSSRTYKYYIRFNVDVAVGPHSITLVGDDHVYLQATVNNTSSNDVSALPVRFEIQDSTTGQWQMIGYDTVDVAAYAATQCRLRYAPYPGDLAVRVSLDPDSTILEDIRSNNVFSDTLQPNIFKVTDKGFILDGRTCQVLNFDTHLSLEWPQGAIRGSSALKIEPNVLVKINQQPDFIHIPETPSYDMRLLSVTAEMQKAIKCVYTLESDSVILDRINQGARLFRFSRQTKKWVRTGAGIEGTTFSVEMNEIGQLAILQAIDDIPPQVQVAIDGQSYVPGKWAGLEPRIGIRLQDPNGVDVSSDKVWISLNGESVDQSEIAFPDSLINGNQIVISYNPVLQPGEQVLQIRATDCNQNVSPQFDFVFRTAQEFDIEMLGNYPNPFKDETRFAYIFKSPVDEMSLKIFTASGRLIRHVGPQDVIEDPNPLAADYHEVLWDGRDDEGYQVANGVYFYQLSGRSEGKTKSVTGKLAKIK